MSPVHAGSTDDRNSESIDKVRLGGPRGCVLPNEAPNCVDNSPGYVARIFSTEVRDDAGDMLRAEIESRSDAASKVAVYEFGRQASSGPRRDCVHGNPLASDLLRDSECRRPQRCLRRAIREPVSLTSVERDVRDGVDNSSVP